MDRHRANSLIRGASYGGGWGANGQYLVVNGVNNFGQSPSFCVLTSCNGYVYSFGAALLDLKRPWKVTHRAAPYLMSPQTLYELVGDVPSVVFPCAALLDDATGRLAIYYGAADTVTGLAFAYMDELISFVMRHS